MPLVSHVNANVPLVTLVTFAKILYLAKKDINARMGERQPVAEVIVNATVYQVSVVTYVNTKMLKHVWVTALRRVLLWVGWDLAWVQTINMFTMVHWVRVAVGA